uniref:Uncharacterized protein n=1 Tax=Rhizophora mucronata TaxID=61149 RepID=A0A2P2Q7A5_RHIMU
MVWTKIHAICQLGYQPNKQIRRV